MMIDMRTHSGRPFYAGDGNLAVLATMRRAGVAAIGLPDVSRRPEIAAAVMTAA